MGMKIWSYLRFELNYGETSFKPTLFPGSFVSGGETKDTGNEVGFKLHFTWILYL